MSRSNRQFTRTKFQAAVGYREKDGHFLEGCVARDISAKGLKIKVEKFFPVNTMLELQFHLSESSAPLFAKGKVSWIKQMPYSERWEAGIELYADKNATIMIQKYISSSNS